MQLKENFDLELLQLEKEMEFNRKISTHDVEERNNIHMFNLQQNRILCYPSRVCNDLLLARLMRGGSYRIGHTAIILVVMQFRTFKLFKSLLLCDGQHVPRLAGKFR